MGRSPLPYTTLPLTKITQIAGLALCKRIMVGFAGIKNIRTSLFTSPLNGQSNFENTESNKYLPLTNFTPLSINYNCPVLGAFSTIRLISKTKRL
jgi:hypothetical protein